MHPLHVQYPQSPEEGVRSADLELTDTEHPVGGRNRTQVLCKRALRHLSSPIPGFLGRLLTNLYLFKTLLATFVNKYLSESLFLL